MKAIRIEATGGAEQLHLRDVEAPAPAPGGVVVRNRAIGVNFIDVYFRQGRYPAALPFTPGQEGAGEIIAIGSDVREVKVGDRVAYGGGGGGAYAEQTAVAAENLVPIPKDIDDATACIAMVQGMTADYLSRDTYPIQRGDHVLIHAAAGGVGALLVQMAKSRGAHVIATVSTSDKARIAREAGADEVIDYATHTEFAAEVRKLSEGGVVCAYDSVGKDTWEQSLASLAPRGYLVIFGQSSGNVPPIDPQLLAKAGSAFLTRPTLVNYIATRSELLERANRVFAAVADGTLNVRVGKTYQLSDAAQAHRDLEARATVGKSILTP